MDKFYQFEMNEARTLLRVTFSGFWTPETSATFFREVATRFGPLLMAGHHFTLLADCTHFDIQAGDIGERFAAYLKVSPNTKKRAMVMGSMLGKMQAERILKHSSVRVFLSIPEAELWLDQSAA